MLKLRFTTLFKVIMLAMLTVGIISSCRRDEHKVKHYDAIQLGTSAVGTKALVINKDSLVSLSYTGHTGFGVYGYKTISSRNYSHRQFNNTLVYPTSGDVQTAKWTYTPTRYWDSDTEASYQFAAYWPHMTANESEANGGPYVSETGKVLTIHDFPYWQEASTGKDLLIASRNGSYRMPNGDPGEEFGGGIVNFNFKHALARVQVRAYYVGAKAKVAVKHVTLLSPSGTTDAVLQDDGKTNVTRAFNVAGTTTGYGTINGGPSKELMTATDTLPESTWFEDLPGTTPEKFDTLCTWLTVPCSLWDSLKIAVDYSIAGSDLSGSASGLTLRTPIVGQNNQPDTLDGQTLPSYSYMITLKFTASSGIEIESIKVQDWINGAEFSKEVYNW